MYKAYFNAFTGVKEYFKKCREDAFERGYILFNNITNRKSYIDFFDEYKQLSSFINKEFWEEYRNHKENNTDRFNSYFKPLVRKYFKMRGEIERRSYNYPIQGSAADITKLSGIFFFNWLLKNNLFHKVLISNVVHDRNICRG